MKDTAQIDTLQQLVDEILAWWDQHPEQETPPTFVAKAQMFALGQLRRYRERCRELEQRLADAQKMTKQALLEPSYQQRCQELEQKLTKVLAKKRRGRKPQAEIDLTQMRESLQQTLTEIDTYCTSEYTRLFDDADEKGVCIPLRLIASLQKLTN